MWCTLYHDRTDIGMSKVTANSTKPLRIQLSRRKGWRMPVNTVKVDRSTKWGNPFIVGVHGTRAYCVHLFRLLCGGYLAISVDIECVERQQAFLKFAKLNLYRLRGKNLACWCPSNALCHADVLLEAANK
jgi:Domain of unknown function (DUF4326)